CPCRRPSPAPRVPATDRCSTRWGSWSAPWRRTAPSRSTTSRSWSGRRTGSRTGSSTRWPSPSPTAWSSSRPTAPCRPP
ncbi:MAG: hypothetical protein AVDCRST_MAG06-2121, partial [uncultured Nocardioides sp.]